MILHIYINKLDNNIIVCKDRKIGYHKRKYLIYRKTWKYCIDIHFDIEFIHTTDLYLILFSYLRYKKLYVLDIYTIAHNSSKSKIFSRKIGYDMNKMSYREFEAWWEHRIWYDSQFLEQKDLYGIRLCFVSNLVDEFILNENISSNEFYYSYKPAYPWDLNVVNIFNYFIDETNEEIFWKNTPKYDKKN